MVLNISTRYTLACPFAQEVSSHVTSWEHFAIVNMAQQANFTLHSPWRMLGAHPEFNPQRMFHGEALLTLS